MKAQSTKQQAIVAKGAHIKVVLLLEASIITANGY